MNFPADSHAHLALTAQKVSDWKIRLDQSLLSGGRIMDVGIQEGDEEARRPFWGAGILYSLGIHPNEAGRAKEPDWSRLEHNLRSGASAIGETGLDLYRSHEHAEIQRTWFLQHLELSIITGLPVIIHCRNAGDSVIRVLKEKTPHSGVMHCFSEDWELARQALDLGLMISFAGNLTYKSSEALRETVKKIPEDKWLVETDSPFLAPVPYRGKDNHPDFISFTLKVIAELRGISPEKAIEQSHVNFNKIFQTGLSRP